MVKKGQVRVVLLAAGFFCGCSGPMISQDRGWEMARPAGLRNLNRGDVIQAGGSSSSGAILTAAQTSGTTAVLPARFVPFRSAFSSASSGGEERFDETATFKTCRPTGELRLSRECTGLAPVEDPKVLSSSYCLSCHDGSVATAVSPIAVGGTAFNGNGDHPVLISYSDAYFRNEGCYTPPGALDPRLRLVEGQIQCATCHSTVEGEQDILVMANDRAQLCLSCHQM